MSKFRIILVLTGTLFLLFDCKKESEDINAGSLQIITAKAGNIVLSAEKPTQNIPVNTNFLIDFSSALDTVSAKDQIFIHPKGNSNHLGISFSFSNNKTVFLSLDQPFEYQQEYVLVVTGKLKGENRESFSGVSFDFKTKQSNLLIQEITLNGFNMIPNLILKDISFEDIELVIHFNQGLDPDYYLDKFSFFPMVEFSATLSDGNKTVTLANVEPLNYYKKYRFIISSSLSSAEGGSFEGLSRFFVTGLDSSHKFPVIGDEDLLSLVQQQTFKYFWDYAHPVSGLARERYLSGETVTIGGSGFGLMAILVGIEREFISRDEGVQRLNTIINFLESADRFHGAWPHWINGTTGKTIPFAEKDDGADLVETSFMAAGLLTVRQYLNPDIQFEQTMILKINSLLETIEWDWFTRGGQDVLYWHWSPNYDWDLNLQIKGYNEALITYFLAAAASDHSIPASVYHKGWANNGGIINGQSYYGIELPLGFPYGGPLFFTHYSFLGLNPQNLSDQYAEYWTQNVNHSLINHQHCVINPSNHMGYGENAWGLTASDDPAGYAVHEPVQDNGTLTPTAALSSMPFTPEASMDALKHFYYILGDKLWGRYGFFDAFNPGEGWWADSYLAINQGPILIMIENYRSGLCWDLFMSAPEVELAMEELGFTN